MISKCIENGPLSIQQFHSLNNNEVHNQGKHTERYTLTGDRFEGEGGIEMHTQY